jgi:hypothetical protein
MREGTKEGGAFAGAIATVRAVAFSSDDRHRASASARDGIVRLQPTTTLHGHGDGGWHSPTDTRAHQRDPPTGASSVNSAPAASYLRAAESSWHAWRRTTCAAIRSRPDGVGQVYRLSVPLLGLSCRPSYFREGALSEVACRSRFRECARSGIGRWRRRFGEREGCSDAARSAGSRCPYGDRPAYRPGRSGRSASRSMGGT